MKRNFILSNYSQILKAQELGTSVQEICNILLKNKSVKVSRQQVSVTLNDAKNKTIFKDTDKIIIFYPFDSNVKNDYADFAIFETGLWLAHYDATTILPPDCIINATNIKNLKSPYARILAKWILQEFIISNEYLLNDIDVSEDEWIKINQIPNIIDKLIQKSVAVTNKKYITWILR